jgi:uncharacterized protein YndB with AHSA1/START domain
VASRVVVSLRVKASPERAFAVFTGEIGAWWKPNGLFAFTPRSPGVMAFEGEAGGRLVERLAGGKVFEVGRITAWEPGRRLAFGWRQAAFTPDQTTNVEVLFEPVGEETRITVTHTGWDSVPSEHVAKHHFPEVVFMRRHGEWWQELLAAVGDRL